MAFLTSFNANEQKAIKTLAGTYASAITRDWVDIGESIFANATLTDAQVHTALFDIIGGNFASTATDAVFAAAVVNGYTTGTSIAQATKDGWVTALTDFLTSGALTRGALVVAVEGIINGPASTDADLAAVQAVVANRAEVGAAYATSTEGATYTTVAALATAVTGVTTDTATINTAIINNGFADTLPAPTSYTVSQSTSSITEGGAAATITITANTTTYAPLTFTYNVAGDTLSGVASAGSASDVQTATGNVTIPAGSNTITFTVTAASDTSTEGLEGLKVSVLGSGNISVGSVLLSVQDAPGGTFTLTTAADKITGTVGDDTITGTLPYLSTGAGLDSSATMTAGDQIDGGSGNDTLSLTISGSDISTTPVSPSMTNVEAVSVSNYETEVAQDVTIDLSLAGTALNKVAVAAGTTSSSDTIFTNIGQTVAYEQTGKGDLTASYATGIMSGAADAATATFKGAGDSTANVTFDVSSIETLNIVSSTAANYVTVAARSFTAVNVSGDQGLTLTVSDADVTAFDASAATGKISANLSAITTANLTSVKGGSGSTDQLTLAGAVTVSSSTNTLSKVSGFETLAISDAATVTLSADTAAINAFNFKTAGSDQVLQLNTGYTGATTVSVESGDKAVNSASVALTVTADSDAFDNSTTITGGTGTDTITLTAKGGTVVLGNVSNVETITILAGTAGTEDVTINVNGADGTVAATKTLTIDASAFTNAGASLTFTGTGETTGLFNITAGAGNDSLLGGAAADTLTGGALNDTIDGAAGNDVISGGDGADSIAAGGGNDSISAGAGNDAIVLAGNLTVDDTIDGGDGTDSLQVSSIDAAALANVTNVENLQMTGSASTATLSSNLSFTTIDIDTADDLAQSVTIASTYTNAVTVKIDAGDSVVNSSTTGMTVTGKGAAFTSATTITGGTTTVSGATVSDTLEITADNSTVDFTGITNVDVVTVKDSTTSGDDLIISLGAYATKLSIDGSALNGTDETLTVNGGSATVNLTVTGGTGNDTLTAGSGNDSLTAGAGNDSITSGSGNDLLSGGDGNDVFETSTNLSFADTVTGGDGTDTLNVDGTRTDTDFLNVTTIEKLGVAGSANVTLGAYAQTAGITTAVLAGAATLSASGMTTTGLTVDATAAAAIVDVTGGGGNDVLLADATGTYDNDDAFVGGLGTDKLQINNDTADADTNGNVVSAELDFASTASVEQVVINDTATDNSAGNVTITFHTNYAQTSLTIDGSALDAGEELTVGDDAGTNLASTEALSIVGGASNDTLYGGAGNDTIGGGSGNDLIYGGLGLDSLTGGAGNDNFSYTVVVAETGTTLQSGGSKVDVITDFAASSDNIRITLSNTASASQSYDFTDKGDVASSADSTALMSSKIGQYVFNTTNSQILMDSTGNGLIQASDLVVALTGATGFSSADMDVVLTTGNGTNTIATGDGADTVTGGTGADTTTTNGGDDQILGIDGKDSIDAGAGNDILSVTATADLDDDSQLVGGSGTDTLVLGAAMDLNNLAYDDLVTKASIEQLVAKEGTTVTILGDTLDADALKINSAAAGDVTLALGTLTDQAFTLANLSFSAFTYGTSTGVALGNDDGDKITVTLANATTNFTGSSIRDEVTGGSTADTINGGAGNDLLVGNADADSITGGEGADSIVGGAGADAIILTETTAAIDTVEFDQVAGLDTITGFAAGSGGVDLLNVSHNDVDGGEVVIAAAAAQGVLTTDRTYVIEQTVGGAAQLTSGGAATVADFTAAASVATYLSERFLGDNDTNASNVDVLFIMNNGTNSYAWYFTDSATANTTIDTAELTLIGTFNSAVLINTDVGQTA